MAANYVCLLIDLDGTIFDFKEAERKAILESLEKSGIEASEENAKIYSKINDRLWKAHEKNDIRKDKLVLQRFSEFLKETGQKGSPAAINKIYVESLSKYAEPYPGAGELLKDLAEFATLAAITNGSYTVQLKRLEESGIGKYFDDVFISEKMGCVKPSPKFFNIALDRLGVKDKKRVLVIGDSLTADIKGGVNAGLDTCWCNFSGEENDSGTAPTYTVTNYEQLKVVAIGEEELKNAANREKRHTL